MASLSTLTTGAKKPDNFSLNVPTDESIGAFLFDISGFPDCFNSYPLLYNNFKDGQIQCIKNMDEAQLLGIEDGFLNGLVAYHLSQFYDYIGGDQTVYISFADCSESWDQITYMHQQTSGKIFHIGIWTSQRIWRIKEDETIGFTSLITDLQTQADEINGKLGTATHSMTPISILLSANTSNTDELKIDYKKIPDAIELNCPKVSVFLVQNGSDEVLEMQANNPLKATVGALGMIMGCMALCGAEESIASVESCDLNRNEGYNSPEWGVGDDGCPIENIHRIWTNIISSRGYIVPIDYEGLEASYFLSSDQTLCQGDFSSIANNRVMHKCRRAMGTALYYYVNSNHIFMPGSKNISPSTISLMTESIFKIIDSVMKNKKGLSQINGRTIEFLENEEMLDNDTLSIKLEILPANYSTAISEEVAHDVE